MENRRYWRLFTSGLERSTGEDDDHGARGVPAEGEKSPRGPSRYHEERAMEVYLAVPTFIRRGVRICG